MNAENFVEFLKDYSKLYQLSYEELKSLAMQYPYCANLHYLLLEKSQLEQHKELEQNLKTASFYSQDRTALRALIQKLKAISEPIDSFDLNEDFLELKDLSSLEEETESIFTEPGQQEGAPKTEERYSDFPVSTDQQKKEKDQEEVKPEQAGEELENLFNTLMDGFTIADPEKEEAEQDQEEKETELEPNEEAPLNEAADESPSPSAQKEEHTTETPSKSATMETPENHSQVPSGKPTPTPKSSFSSWVQQFQPAHIKVQLHELMESKKREDAKEALRRRKKKKKIKDKVVLFAEQSLKESTDLASETLAELLVAQEQYDKAIQMYERLILIFPEKSTYFAEKIEKLKNK